MVLNTPGLEQLNSSLRIQHVINYGEGKKKNPENFKQVCTISPKRQLLGGLLWNVCSLTERALV